MPIKEKGQNATQIANIDVSSTAPTDTQVLAYSSSADQWEPSSAGSAANTFGTIAVSGQDNVVADSTTDTLTLAAGSNITITTTAGSDTITIAAADTNTQLTQEQVEDYVNGVIVGGTNITATYDDAAGTLTLVGTDTNTQTESFKTISVSGQDDVVADSSTDTLTLAAGSNITITTTAGSDTITIAATDTTGGWTDGTNIITLTTPADKVGLGQSTPLVALDVLHDPTGLAGDTGGGESIKIGSGTTVAGKLYFLNTSGAWVLAQADAVSTGASQLLAIALGTTPGTHGMLIRGFFDLASYLTGTFVQGAAVYVSETTAGTIDVAAPAASGDYVRIVGYGTTTANCIYFSPSNNWVEL